MTDELKPCPFCGSSETLTPDDQNFVGCYACGVDDVPKKTWNTRTPPKVKPLEWSKTHSESVFISFTEFCEYIVCKNRGGESWDWHYSDEVGRGPYNSIEEAKAAAQEHFDEMILGALE